MILLFPNPSDFLMRRPGFLYKIFLNDFQDKGTDKGKVMSRKKRKTLPPFVAISREAMRGKEWRSLTPKAKIVYLHLKYKFVGHNNGDIVLHYSELKDMFSSKTIARAFRELEDAGWIERTHYGGLYRYVNKYELTGKYDTAFLK